MLLRIAASNCSRVTPRFKPTISDDPGEHAAINQFSVFGSPLSSTATDAGGLSTNSSPVEVIVANNTGGGGDWSQDLELNTWTTAGNPAGKVFKKDYLFTPASGSYTAMTVHIGGTASVAGGLNVTIYCNGSVLGTQTAPSGTLDITFAPPDASLANPGQANTLRVEVGTLYKGDTVSVNDVIVSLTAATAP